MKGSYEVEVSNRALSYRFTIRRNITIIQGDSATGKTTLVDMIREHELQGEDSAVSLQCQRPCIVVEGSTWQRQLASIEDSIVFIDEGNRFIATKEFAEFVLHSSNYYVLVTREALYTLPYSIEEIYGIHSSGKYGGLEPVYHETYHLYSADQNLVETSPEGKHQATLMTEDSSSGYQFFKAICQETMNCVSAEGNSGIVDASSGII